MPSTPRPWIDRDATGVGPGQPLLPHIPLPRAVRPATVRRSASLPTASFGRSAEQAVRAAIVERIEASLDALCRKLSAPIGTQRLSVSAWRQPRPTWPERLPLDISRQAAWLGAKHEDRRVARKGINEFNDIVHRCLEERFAVLTTSERFAWARRVAAPEGWIQSNLAERSKQCSIHGFGASSTAVAYGPTWSQESLRHHLNEHLPFLLVLQAAERCAQGTIQPARRP